VILAAAGLCACQPGTSPFRWRAPSLVVERVPRPTVAADSIGPMSPTLDQRCAAVGFAFGGELYRYDPASGWPEFLSMGAGALPANRPSGIPRFSADGALVAFDSAATNLDEGDQRNNDHVFVRDLRNGVIMRVSQRADGEPANGANLAFHGGLAISADGRSVAWNSYASDLVPDDRNGRIDVFVRDLAGPASERASVSSDGREGSGDSLSPSLAADGRLVAFASDAPDLVPGDTNGVRDVFLRDRAGATTERISLVPGGGEADGASDLPALSANGRFVAFASEAGNLVANDANAARDVFVLDRRTRTISRASADVPGRAGDVDCDAPVIDADGSRVAFVCGARAGASAADGGFASVYVFERRSRSVLQVSRGLDAQAPDEESGTWGIAISGDGRCVAFTSLASNLTRSGDRPGGDLFIGWLVPPEAPVRRDPKPFRAFVEGVDDARGDVLAPSRVGN
jgi:Tol biopolymer transport system component